MTMDGGPPSGHCALLLRITGQVQGVWYRGWSVDEATALGLTGWVRNRRDGSVEVLAAGPKAAVDEFVRACRQGPIAARVEAVTTEPADPPEGEGFRQLPTL